MRRAGHVLLRLGLCGAEVQAVALGDAARGGAVAVCLEGRKMQGSENGGWPTLKRLMIPGMHRHWQAVITSSEV